MRGESYIVKQLLQKAKDSALLAIEYYNKPAVSFKSEGFIVMMCIAWTAFFHAYFLKNKMKPFYRKKDTGKKPRFEYVIEKLPNGNEIKDKKWWELNKCVREFFKKKQDIEVQRNIEFLSGLRNLIVHRNLPELDASIFAECQASVLNFNEYLKNYFDDKQDISNFLSFSIQMFNNPQNFLEASEKELKNKNAVEVVEFIKSFRSSLSTKILESSKYSFKAVLIQVKNHESKNALAIRFIHEKDLTEEQKDQLKNIGIVMIKEKTIIKDDIPSNFSMTYNELKKQVKLKLSNFNNRKFEKIKEYFKVKFINRLVYERVHNPKSKKSSSTFYYDPKITDEFEKMYPFFTANHTNVQKIDSLIDKIISAKRENPQSDTQELEREIDKLVYQLYDLTEEEIKIIEKEK